MDIGFMSLVFLLTRLRCQGLFRVRRPNLNVQIRHFVAWRLCMTEAKSFLLVMSLVGLRSSQTSWLGLCTVWKSGRSFLPRWGEVCVGVGKRQSTGFANPETRVQIPPPTSKMEKSPLVMGTFFCGL